MTPFDAEKNSIVLYSLLLAYSAIISITEINPSILEVTGRSKPLDLIDITSSTFPDTKTIFFYSILLNKTFMELKNDIFISLFLWTFLILVLNYQYLYE